MNFDNPEINKYQKEIYNYSFDELSSQLIAEYIVDLDMVLKFESNDDNEEIYFTLIGESIEIDYGDDKNETFDKINRQVRHRYEEKGAYIVRIKGNLINFSSCSNNIKKVINWNYYLEDLSYAFHYCIKLKEVPNYIPSNIQYISNMFFECSNFNSDISEWDVYNVRDMSYMFSYCINFNSDLSKWNVFNVQNMTFMFLNCSKFNLDISKWNVSNVQNMIGMFYGCHNFNSNISKWNVSNVQNMCRMFCECYDFNSDISKWDVSSVKESLLMFFRCHISENYKPKLKN